jgi:CheY-like chemotaxis protein
LGLSISNALISGHGGTLTAHSEGKGRGATFTMRMPTVVDLPQPSPCQPLDHGANYSSRSLKILLVEDHESTLRILRKLLEEKRHQVTTATSIASAIEAAERERFDLLISDVGLPDGLGCEIMRAVHSKYGLKGIALSGYGMDIDIQKSREAGFLEHLTKPVDMETLEAAISRVIRMDVLRE